MATAVTLYEEKNLGGEYIAIPYGLNYGHLGDVEWDNKACSVKVTNGYYVDIYEDEDFQGDRKAMLPQEYKDLKDLGWDKKISSLRTYTRCAAILYSDKDYKGRSIVVSGNMMNLDDIGFNNTVSSIKVMPGYELTVYAAADFKEGYAEYNESKDDVKDMKGKISSIKVKCQFAVEIYTDKAYSGTSRQLKTGITNINEFGKLASLKLNAGYKAELFSEENGGGICQAVYLGPCDIENIDKKILSMNVTTHYAVRAYESFGCKGSYIEFSNSVYKLDAYGWNDKISSMQVDSGYFVQICTGNNYSDDRMVLTPVSGMVDFKDGLSDWNKKVSSIRIIKKDMSAVYLFDGGNYGDGYVRMLNDGITSHHHWYWDGDDGKEHHIDNDSLSSLLIVGNFQVTLYENSDINNGDKMILNGPGFFDLAAQAVEDTIEKSIFDDKVTKINIASYTSHPTVLSNVRGYGYDTILLRGDLHNHTFWSDAYWGGKGGIHYIDDPKQTFRIYQAFGYDFDGISDHLFGCDSDGTPRYTDGNTRGIPIGNPKYALSPNEWEKTMIQAACQEHNYNFSSIAGYEYGLAGIKPEVDDDENDPKKVAHYNVFGTETLYYGKPGLWHNTPDSRTDFYRWGEQEYQKNPGVIIQFNHPSDGGKGFNYFEPKEAWDSKGSSLQKKAFVLLEVYSASGEGDDKSFFEAYNKALNQGWKVGPTATSDNHDGIKSIKEVYEHIRTVVATKEVSKDAILDALRKRRVYATRIPALNVGFSVTNNANETVLMGGDIERHNEALSIDVGLSGSRNSETIMAIEFHTNKGVIKLDIDSKSPWPLLKSYTLTAEQLDGVKYIFATVVSDKHDENSVVTAPVWIIG